MKRSMTYKTILSVGGLVVLFAYQNCGKVTSGLLIEDKGLAQGQIVNGLPSDPTTVDTGAVPLDPGTTPIDPIKVGPGQQPGAPGSPAGPVVKNPNPGTPGGIINPLPTPITPIETCVLRPEPNTTVAIKAASQKSEKEDERTPAIAATSEVRLVDPVSGLKYCPILQTNPIPSVVDPGEIQDADVADAVAHCREANKARVAQTLTLSDFNGQYVGTVENVGSVSNLVGSLILRAASTHSSIGSISNIRANNKFKTNRTIVLCGYDSVNNISDVNGHVILVDSHVRSLSNLRGSLSLVNSIIDTISDTANSEINYYE